LFFFYKKYKCVSFIVNYKGLTLTYILDQYLLICSVKVHSVLILSVCVKSQIIIKVNCYCLLLNPCHTRVASLQRSHSVLKNCRTPRCALCKRQQRCANAVETLCNRLERHAAAFTLSMLKTNAAAWRFYSVLDRTLWQRCGVF